MYTYFLAVSETYLKLSRALYKDYLETKTAEAESLNVRQSHLIHAVFCKTNYNLKQFLK